MLGNCLKWELSPLSPTFQGEGTFVLWLRDDDDCPVAVAVGILIGGGVVGIPGSGKVGNCERNATYITADSAGRQRAGAIGRCDTLGAAGVTVAPASADGGVGNRAPPRVQNQGRNAGAPGTRTGCATIQVADVQATAGRRRCRRGGIGGGRRG